MATTRRYQSDQRAGTPQGRDPFSYGQGIRAPAAPNIPMPPRPAGAPPGPPRIYEPRITPAQAQFEGQAKIASQLSQTLDAWGDRFFKQAAAQAEKTGYETGLEYGHQTDSMELRGGTTIYDMAFNKGARETYKSRLALDSKERISQLEISSNGRTSTFDQTAKAYRDSTLKAIEDPESRAYAARKIDERIVDSRTRLLKQEYADARAVQVSQVDTTLEQNRGDIKLAIDRKDYAQAFNLVVEGEQHIAAAVDSLLIDEAEAEKQRKALKNWARLHVELERFQEELENAKPILDENGNPTGQTSADLYYSHFANNLPRAKGVELTDEDDEGAQFVDELGFDNEQMTPELHAKIVDEMWSLRGRQSSLEAGERAKASAEAKAYKTQLTERKDDAMTALKEGQVPPDFAELMDEVRATGDFKLINDLDEEKAFFDAGVNFRALPLDVQAQYLSEQAARRDMSGDEAELFKRLEASHNKIRSDIASGNGLLRAAKDGLFDQSLLAVPNIQTPDDFANFLRQRDGMASLAQSHYGVPIDRLNPAEVSDMVEQYANTDTDGKLQLFGAIVDNLQPEAAVQLLEQFDKKGASNFAMAGAVYIDGATDVAARILKGQSTPSEIMPDNREINPAIFDIIGNVYMGDQTDAATVSVMNAIKAVYAYDSFIAGDVSAELDPTRLESAINEVTGGIATIEWNGSGGMFNADDDYSVPVPVRGMDSDDMETWLESITADDLMQQGGTHSAFPETQVAELLNDGQLKLIFARGFGDKAGYMLQTYNGGFVLGSDGLVFLLEHSPGAE